LDLGEQKQHGGEEEQDGEISPGHRRLLQRMVAVSAVAAVFSQLAAVGAPEDADSFHAHTPFLRFKLASPAFELDGEAFERD
jgi:hypothetical protein